MTMENLKNADVDVYNAIKKEEYRLKNSIELIASENIPSKAVKELRYAL